MQFLVKKLKAIIWDADLKEIPWWKAWILGALRFIYIMVVEFLDGQLNLRAMSLVFTTVLSIVPLIAVSFSVMKVFGVHNRLEPLLQSYLSPLGEQGHKIAVQMMEFVDNVQVGALGGVGLVLLFFIIVRLIQKIEFAFNYTWRVHQSGSLVRRFSNYLSVIMVGPVLVFIAVAVTGTAMNTTVAQIIISIEPFGTLLRFVTHIVPYILIIAAFTFTYIFIPNTKVKPIPAITGGVVAGVLWQTVEWVFAAGISSSMSSNYTAIYSSFAFLFLFMIWLWWSWLILLVGSSVAFYRQYPESLSIYKHQQSLTNRQKEELALELMTVIGQRFYNSTMPVFVNELVETLHLPKESIEKQLDLFEAHGLLLKADEDIPAYSPAYPLSELTLKTVVDTVREPEPGSQVNSLLNQTFPSINSLLSSVDNHLDKIMGNKTIKELVNEQNKSLSNDGVASEEESA